MLKVPQHSEKIKDIVQEVYVDLKACRQLL